MGENRRAMLIAGPTASGKSALAIKKARAQDALIINTDSMQVYDVLSVLTARPQPDELAQADHRLYGVIPPQERFSTGAWVAKVNALIAQTDATQQPLIFVGGTGLYFESLINGVAPVPEVPSQLAALVEDEVRPLDRAGRKALLQACDPEVASRINEPDYQRVVRALSVLKHTGKSLAYWQDAEHVGVLNGFTLEKNILNPDRDVLRQRIADRFENMMDIGAADEVAAILDLRIDPSLPAMKAIGVREIADWQAGRTTKEKAIELATIATQQYAKRQRTWFRNRMSDWTWID